MPKVVSLELTLDNGQKVKVLQDQIPNALLRKLSRSMERFTQQKRVIEPHFDTDRNR